MAACGSNNGAESGKKEIVVAATKTPHAEILKEAEPLLKEKGYTLKVKVFSDYKMYNKAVFVAATTISFLPDSAPLFEPQAAITPANTSSNATKNSFFNVNPPLSFVYNICYDITDDLNNKYDD